ncbi:PREDICTED: protein root UVB sensitive 5 isoform X2 [Tarenaya hassleriana]|uniref:protein root UVB sensitive 5 isoform X2 n=1 Tax=Tarenaya hassleriana TaxID=28532 RepID=UPI00053C1A9A|nr:PREDICTED: protein root UVB sensitive 5 isoform X2 [Tarenaya hassleriana]
MYYSLRFPLPLTVHRTRRLTFSMLKRRRLEYFCCYAQSSVREDDEEEEEEKEESFRDRGFSIVVERYGNGASKRYVLNDETPLQGLLEERDSKHDDGCRGSNLSDTTIFWVPDVVKDFVLPAGFPGSVSDDYLEYMLLQFPTNVTGWICNALVTSSLLKAVGVGSFSGTTAAASAAAIRWVSKDGIGALGRLLIGGRFGSLFDDDPKQWRMYADFIGSAGSIFDLATQLYPAYFLPLASTGNLAKAVARGLKDPSFRVIQNHFAISGNLGGIAAKEEVWEVAAQLLGLGIGILILDTPGVVKSFPILSLTWLSVRLVHLWLRYQSLIVLRFNTVNVKRARILVQSHVLYSVVPGYVDGNRQESILIWQRFMKPRIIFGAPLEEISGLDKSVSKVKELLKIYKKEQYILTLRKWEKDAEFLVSFKVGATSTAILRCLWHAYWLHENMDDGDGDGVLNKLKRSLYEMDSKFEDFMQKLGRAGWNILESNLKVPNHILIDEV